MNFIIDISEQFVALVDIEKKKILAVVENDARTNNIFIENNKRIYIQHK